MSQVANCGHWVVAVLFGLLGLCLLGYFVWGLAATIHSFHSTREINPPEAGETVGYAINLASLEWIPLLICAWGILRRRAWGHVLTAALCILTIMLGIQLLVFRGVRDSGASNSLTIVAACLILAWLLLPSVRREYWRGERPA